MADEFQLLVNYYVRMSYGQHIKSLCSRHLQKRHKDPVLLFWHAFGSLLDGSSTEAMRELQILMDQKEIEFAAVALMLYVQKSYVVVDEEEVQRLNQKLEAAEKCASERALFLAATLYSHVGGTSNVKKAKDLIAKIIRVQPHHAPAICTSAWLNLMFDKEGRKIGCSYSESHNLDSASVEGALGMFDEVLAKGDCIEAFLGKAYYYEIKNDIPKALDELTQVIVSYPSFIPALCEKARLALLVQDWVLVQESAQLILHKDPKNIEGLRLTIHVMLCMENDMHNVARLLDELLDCIVETETRNANLCLQIASPLARIAGRGHLIVLQKTLALVERARRLVPEHASFAIEMADQQFLLADYGAALSSYRVASQLDALNLDAMYGVVQCLLVLGEIEEAEQQLEFLVEICFSTGKSASLCYLMAQLAWEKSKDYSQCQDLLVKTLQYHTEGLSKKQDFNFYVQLNPDRLLGVVSLFSILSRYECKGLHMSKSFCLERSVEILELVLRSIPGLLTGYLMLAEILIELEEFESAQSTLQTTLTLDATCASAQILLAQVRIKLGKYGLAKECLEQALSGDFTVRDTVEYHVLQAQMLIQADQKEEALMVLESAMCLPGMKAIRTGSPRDYYFSNGSKKIKGITDNEVVLAHLLQADVHMRLGHILEATKIIQDAMHQFKGTPQEVQVVLANCDLALARGDVNAALSVLGQVPCESNYYVQAKVAIADIYMKYWHDKSQYVNCYLELAEMFPGAETYMMLGDAFMKIDELERAVKEYEAAMRESPKDASVACRVGRALVTTHYYSKAVDHYKSALQNTEDGHMKFVLRHDLAGAPQNYEEAEMILNDMLARVDANIEDKELKDMSNLLLCLKGSLLLSKVEHLLGKCGTPIEESKRLGIESKYLHHYKVMFRAKNIQNRLLPKLHGQHGDTFREQKNVAADIYFQFAQECEVQKDLEKTVTLLNEALNCNPAHHPSTLALAKIHLSRGNMNECEKRCADILRADPFNTEAGDILVHLMLTQEMYDSAMIHFKQNLERNSTHYASLAQLIRLLHSCGQMEEAQQYILKAEMAFPRSHTDAGLHFCKGLIARYSNKPFEALQMLNLARADAEWGLRAIHLVIEIYLNIHNGLVWEEANVDDIVVGNEEGIKMAWQLLGDSRVLDRKSVKQLVLECYVTMATRQKADIECALGRLTEMVGKEERKVPILLAIATAWTLLKQTAKAKIHLRVIDHSVYNWEDGEDFERAWLMLAAILMQSGKHAAAQDLCRKCLKYNKDCGRAWEYLGQAMELGHSFAEAVGSLENAWKCSNKASPSVGYRLASLYLKEKRYIEAISVCHKVLKACNNHPRIKKDILDKARSCIRV